MVLGSGLHRGPGTLSSCPLPDNVLSRTYVDVELACRFEKVELFQVELMFMKFRLYNISKQCQEPLDKSDTMSQPTPYRHHPGVLLFFLMVWAPSQKIT